MMKNKGDFGHATNGSTGFRCMYDGGDNKFKIRSADDATVNDRLTIERDSGSVGIGNPTVAAGLGLTIHQSGQAECGISIYASSGRDSVLNLMKNRGDFGHANNGSTGFRCMFDGGDNKFKIRSADDANVFDRLTLERDSGDCVLSGGLNLANLPTENPEVAGQLWRSGNDLKISTG